MPSFGSTFVSFSKARAASATAPPAQHLAATPAAAKKAAAAPSAVQSPSSRDRQRKFALAAPRMEDFDFGFGYDSADFATRTRRPRSP